MLKKVLTTIFLFLLIWFSSANSDWLQEDLSIAGATTLKNKIEYLKDIEENWIISKTRISYNLSELKKLYNSWKIATFVKKDYLQALMNNLYWIEIDWELIRSYFWYKVVDDTEILSIERNFLIEIQKAADWTYRDVWRTEIQSNKIADVIQLYFEEIVYPTEKIIFKQKPWVLIFNHYSYIFTSKTSWYAINTVFEEVCNKMVKSTICIEEKNGWILWIWLRDTVDAEATNQDEYKELISNYEIDWKVQIPSSLKNRLENICPVTLDHTVAWFIENDKLDECWLIPHDFDCDWKKEWIDINDSLRTTTVYSINLLWTWVNAIIKVKIILYLNWKKIVKLYWTPSWCFSHALTKEWDETASYKTIYRNFDWIDVDLQYIKNSENINDFTISEYSIASKELSIEQYNFFITKNIENIWIENDYKIDFEVKDKKELDEKKEILWLIWFSNNTNPVDIWLKLYVNQDKFWIEKGWSKILFDSSENWINNSKKNHYTITLNNSILTWEINWKKYFSYDTSTNSLKVENWLKLLEHTGSFSNDDLKLNKYLLFSNQYISWNQIEKEYSNFYISKPESSKLYLYKLNQSNDVTNFYLWQIIDTFDYTYDLIQKWTSLDQICKSLVRKNWIFFDNNKKLDPLSNSYIWYNDWNWCNFLAKKIYFYSDLNWKLSYLKKINITGNYDITDQVFKFKQSEENIIQWSDYWTILDWILKNCSMIQVINNELDSCSILKGLDVDNDGWKEWVLSKDWEFEIYNNVIIKDILWNLTSNLQQIYKSSWDTYCTVMTWEIDYYKKWSWDSICKKNLEVDEIVTNNGWTKETCDVDSVLVTNWINNYQFIYWVIGTNKEDKKYRRTQILQNSTILCD